MPSFTVTAEVRTRALEVICEREGLQPPKAVEHEIGGQKYSGQEVTFKEGLGLAIIFGPIPNADSFRPVLSDDYTIDQVTDVMMAFMQLYIEETIVQMGEFFGPEVGEKMRACTVRFGKTDTASGTVITAEQTSMKNVLHALKPLRPEDTA